MIPVPSPDEFGLDVAIAGAIEFVSATSGVWLMILGLGIGALFVGLILTQLRRVLP